MSNEEPEKLPAPPGDMSRPDSGPYRPAAVLGITPPRSKRPPDSARCSACGGSSLSCVRTFSAGSGIVARPFAEDVICHDCGIIAPPSLTGK